MVEVRRAMISYMFNTVPSITIPSISPSSGITISSQLTCSGSATDLNDGALGVSYRHGLLAEEVLVVEVLGS